jgi:hypothetical protein
VELVEVTPTPLQRRAGAVWVPWHELAAQQRRRGREVKALAPGDDVLLQLDGDVVCRGWVLRHAFAGQEGAYVIMFGSGLSRRVPVTDRRPEPRRRQAPEPRVQDVVVRVVPQQRQPGHEERRRVNLYL